MTQPKDGKELVERLLSSESKGELLMLFHKNPGLVDTVEGVARRIGRHEDQIVGDVKDFIEMGLFKESKAGKLTLVSFDQEKDREIQGSMTRYIRGTGN